MVTTNTTWLITIKVSSLDMTKSLKLFIVMKLLL